MRYVSLFQSLVVNKLLSYYQKYASMIDHGADLVAVFKSEMPVLASKK